MSAIASRRTADSTRTAVGSDADSGSGSGAKIRRSGFVRQIGYGAALFPASLATLGAALVGRPSGVRRWWARASGQDAAVQQGSGRQPGRLRLLGHALLCLPLGLMSLIPIGVEVLFILRGVFYGLVDDGPYNNSWGGPTRAGAWAAHFAIALPIAIAGLGALWVLNRLQTRLAGGMWGRKVGAAPFLISGVLMVGSVALFISWIHQL